MSQGWIKAAIYIYRQGWYSARRLCYPQGEATCLRSLAEAYFYLGDLEKAKKYNKHSLKRAQDNLLQFLMLQYYHS
ncbi:MAG: hypothetical protein KME46_04695 [Brasilonema angustatum HA4187-MV1]|jgi:methionine salvage enolase-phosphatase E1|nr:hypothetical protein [Brasilonema angustatum HA4187-MV1]